MFVADKETKQVVSFNNGSGNIIVPGLLRLEKGPLVGYPKFQKYEVILLPVVVLVKATDNGPHPE